MSHQQLINPVTYWLIAIGLWGISLSAVAEPIFNPDYGHYYELVVSDKDLTFDEAAEASRKRTFKGVAGHLLTVIDGAEAAFLLKHQQIFSTGSSSWIGLRSDEQTGFFEFDYDYTWVTGQSLNIEKPPKDVWINRRGRDEVKYTAHYKYAMRYQNRGYLMLVLENWRSDDKLASYIVEYDVKLPLPITLKTDTPKAKKGATILVSANLGGVDFSSKTPEICKVDNVSKNDQVASFNLIGRGICTVTAKHDGNESYSPAEATLNIEVTDPIDQTVTFNKIENQVLIPKLTVKMVATASSGLPVVFKSNTPICKNFPPPSPTNNVLTIYNAGICTVMAIQEGNENFKPVTVTQSFTIAKGESSISLFLPKTLKIYNSLFLKNHFGRVGSTQPFTFSTKTQTCKLEDMEDGNYNLRVIETGTCTLSASLAGDNDYHAAPEITVDIQVLPLDKQTVTFVKVPDKTFGDPDFTIYAKASSGKAVVYSIANPQNEVCEVSDAKTGKIKITGAGPCIIEALQQGYFVRPNSPKYPVFEFQKASAHYTVGIHKAIPVINFSAPDAGIVGDRAQLNATAPSSVHFSSSTLGICTVGTDAENSRGEFLNTVNFVGKGTCMITATASGDSNYKPNSETRNITVKEPKKLQTVTFNQLTDKVFGDADFTIAAKANSGLPVSFSTGKDSNGCSITDHTVKITKAGTCIIHADQAGNDEYLPARTNIRQFKIAHANQTIQFKPATTGTLGAIMNLSAIGGASGNPVVFSSDSDICDVVLGDVNLIDNEWKESHVVRFWRGEGTCNVVASQAGNDQYNDAQVVANITVTKPKIPKRDQHIVLGESLKSLDVKQGDQVKLSAMSTPSSLPVIFATEVGNKVCSITGDTLKITGVGICILKMDQPGNDEFNPAPTDTLSIQVKKREQTMKLSQFSSTAEVGAMTLLYATGGDSGNPVRFHSQTPKVCTVKENNVVTFVAPGKCILLINQAGNAFYNEARWARYNDTWLQTLNITVTAATPESQLITAPVSNAGQTLTDRTVTDTGSVSGGTLCGHTANSGSVFGVTICEGGQVTNCSNTAAGIIRNVTLNPNATVRCGTVAGEVICKSPETSVLENLTVTANSRLVDCKIGENVVFQENVVLTDTQDQNCSSTAQ